MGRHEEAISEIRLAQGLDPVSPLIQTIGSEVFYYARRYDDAMDQARKAVLLDPNFYLAYHWLAHNSAQQGMHEEALEQCEEAERVARGERRSAVAYVYALAGKRRQALSLVGQLPRQERRPETPATFVANVYLHLGEKELALEWLEKAHEESDPYMAFLNVAPQWDALRSAPRFQDLLRRMKFP